MSGMKEFGRDGTALGAVWSAEEYDRWVRAEEERGDAAREAGNHRALMRYDPECEAAVRALEEAGWGSWVLQDGKA